MSDADLLARCGQQLMDLRSVYAPLNLAVSTEPELPSNGLPIGDLSDYSALLDSLQELRYMILSCRNDQIPINLLPVEILLLICKFTLPPNPEFIGSDNIRVFCVMKLTHVCKRWRLALISSPVLWTDFRVVRAAPKFVAACLQRSEMLPIHVSFKWDSRDPNYNSPSTSVAEDDGSVVDDGNSAVADEGTDEISSNEPEDSYDGISSHSTMSVYPDHRDADYSWAAYIKEAQGYHHLMQHSHRIATLDITFSTLEGNQDEEEDSLFAYGLLFYPLPALQTLKLRGTWGSAGSIEKVILDEHVTAINSLFLEDIIPTRIMDLPLNLTSLALRVKHGTKIDTSSFLRFLEKNRNLRSLTLHNYCFLPILDPVAPVTLSSLRQLDVLSNSAMFLRHLVAPPLGPQSSFRMERIGSRLVFLGENSVLGTSASVSSLLPNVEPVPDELVSLISEAFGSGWEEAARVTVVTPVEGWEREFVDQLLNRLAKLTDLSVECDHGRVGPWFDSLVASKERCPKLRGIRLLNIAPECCPTVIRSVRKLVKLRMEDGIPLDAVEETGRSLSTKAIWDDLYDRWRIGDYLRTRETHGG